ncbi:Histone-lysine N-methyltransferase set9 [Mortierella sp. GBA30]|nr:Histone-lysine N-methyltransferase set9 [Mortierella sp. GBA30]
MYLPTAGFDISQTDRYTAVTNKSEACVIATKAFEPGHQIQACAGAVAKLNDKEEQQLESETSDFSVVRSSRSGTLLFLGPARFVNHDCDPNCELQRSGTETICFRVIKPISVNDEITTSYGDNYFGPNNQECLCATCESTCQGAFAPKTSEAESSPAESASVQDEAPPSRGLRNRRAVNYFPWRKKADPKQRYTPTSTESPSAQSRSGQDTPAQEHSDVAQTESASYPVTETSSASSDSPVGAADSLPQTPFTQPAISPIIPSVLPPIIPLVVWPVTQPMVLTQMTRETAPRLAAIVDNDDDDKEDNNNGHTSIAGTEDRDYESSVEPLIEHRLILAMEELQMADSRDNAAIPQLAPPTIRTHTDVVPAVNASVDDLVQSCDGKSATVSKSPAEAVMRDTEPATASVIEPVTPISPSKNFRMSIDFLCSVQNALGDVDTAAQEDVMETSTNNKRRKGKKAVKQVDPNRCSTCKSTTPQEQMDDSGACRRCHRHFLLYQVAWPSRRKDALIAKFRQQEKQAREAAEKERKKAERAAKAAETRMHSIQRTVQSTSGPRKKAPVKETRVQANLENPESQVANAPTLRLASIQAPPVFPPTTDQSAAFSQRQVASSAMTMHHRTSQHPTPHMTVHDRTPTGPYSQQPLGGPAMSSQDNVRSVPYIPRAITDVGIHALPNQDRAPAGPYIPRPLHELHIDVGRIVTDNHPFHHAPYLVFVDPQEGPDTRYWWIAVTVPRRQLDASMPEVLRMDDGTTNPDSVVVRFLEDFTYSVCNVSGLKLFLPDGELYQHFVHEYSRSFIKNPSVRRAFQFLEGRVAPNLRWRLMDFSDAQPLCEVADYVRWTEHQMLALAVEQYEEELRCVRFYNENHRLAQIQAQQMVTTYTYYAQSQVTQQYLLQEQYSSSGEAMSSSSQQQSPLDQHPVPLQRPEGSAAAVTQVASPQPTSEAEPSSTSIPGKRRGRGLGKKTLEKMRLQALSHSDVAFADSASGQNVVANTSQATINTGTNTPAKTSRGKAKAIIDTSADDSAQENIPPATNSQQASIAAVPKKATTKHRASRKKKTTATPIGANAAGSAVSEPSVDPSCTLAHENTPQDEATVASEATVDECIQRQQNIERTRDTLQADDVEPGLDDATSVMENDYRTRESSATTVTDYSPVESRIIISTQVDVNVKKADVAEDEASYISDCSGSLSPPPLTDSDASSVIHALDDGDQETDIDIGVEEIPAYNVIQEIYDGQDYRENLAENTLSHEDVQRHNENKEQTKAPASLASALLNNQSRSTDNQEALTRTGATGVRAKVLKSELERLHEWTIKNSLPDDEENGQNRAMEDGPLTRRQRKRTRATTSESEHDHAPKRTRP